MPIRKQNLFMGHRKRQRGSNPDRPSKRRKRGERKKNRSRLSSTLEDEKSCVDPIFTFSIQLEEIEVPSSYEGPRYDSKAITLSFVEEMIEWFKKQKQLHIKYAYRILIEIIAFMKTEPTIMHIIVPPEHHFTVCGDIHGQFYDMLNIFKLNGPPSSNNPYLFNGDFVDRGSFSCEVIFTLFAYKLLYPDGLFLNRGNHETLCMNQTYGFQGEVLAKYDDKSFDLFQIAFNWLPLGTVLGRKVLVLHGGLFSEDDVTIQDLEKIQRDCQPPESGPMCEMLWSDPVKTVGRVPSERGIALGFGPDVTEAFLLQNGLGKFELRFSRTIHSYVLELIIRSHEVKQYGYEIEKGCRLVTVFSAPNYCDEVGIFLIEYLLIFSL